MDSNNQYKLFICKLTSFIGIIPNLEYKAIEGRKFAFDIAFPSAKVAVEINGGTYSERSYFSKKKAKIITVVGGRHNSGKGYIKDLEKMNLAQLNGWIVLQYTPEQLNELKTFEQINLIIKERLKSLL